MTRHTAFEEPIHAVHHRPSSSYHLHANLTFHELSAAWPDLVDISTIPIVKPWLDLVAYSFSSSSYATHARHTGHMCNQHTRWAGEGRCRKILQKSSVLLIGHG